ncbi:GNAT family N-acetyltransferase [Streptosporangium roseum]|uniref:GNAT family N-acetyltransferase n=1 Tax=Streptosporangium roseum TaxID=2001 RepID=UPI0004CC931A|nr:GNAT family N-acetyltransferase [Streptosporangium roseum]
MPGDRHDGTPFLPADAAALERPGSSAVAAMIRLARPGDRPGVEALARVALGADAEMPAGPGAFATVIDRHGGRLALPHGTGYALVAEDGEAAEGAPIGLAYTCPPVQLIDQYAELGARGQRRLAGALAELELLAVAEHARGVGVGTALLAAAEERLRRGGCRLVFAKVRLGDRPVLEWYRSRGYLLAAHREPVTIDVDGAMIVFDDGGDGYRLAVKSLDPTRQVHRGSPRTGTYLAVTPARPSPTTGRRGL